MFNRTNDDIVILTKNDSDPIICFGREGSHEFFVVSNLHDYYAHSDGTIYPLEIVKYYTKEPISHNKTKFDSYNISGVTDFDLITYSTFTGLLILDYKISLTECDKNEISYGLNRYMEYLTYDDIESDFENIFEHHEDTVNNQSVLGKMFIDRLKIFKAPIHHVPDKFLAKIAGDVIEQLIPLHLEKQQKLQSNQFDFENSESFWCDYKTYGKVVDDFKSNNGIKNYYQLFENFFIQELEKKQVLESKIDNKINDVNNDKKLLINNN